MKSVLISIQPKKCELIASGKEMVEVRKTRPKIDTPFKCYIYCTNISPYLVLGDVFTGRLEGKFTSISGCSKKEVEKIWNTFNGKVIGEFICDKVYDFIQFGTELAIIDLLIDCENLEKEKQDILNMTCLTEEQICNYIGTKDGYGWHISDLVIYDKPKELSEFRTYNIRTYFENGYPMPTHEIKRPPQSWYYVDSIE